MTFDQWLKLFTSPQPLLRKGSLNFGNVRNDAQQKLEAQSPLARSNQVEGNYLLLAVNYEAKLLVSLMLLFTAVLLFSNNHAYNLSGEVKTQIAFNLSIVDIQESYMGIEENITINICVFSVSQLDKGKCFSVLSIKLKCSLCAFINQAQLLHCKV
ncbi:hypothetical protein T02_5533 [Trichinella nativa]|uniref:Uncharacterized protein n=1 Tax=Trichinella nativa TaxID=6335 RepID=A0A0V1L9K3_9BILA|nr:hypothetical protein T02_5533 [Trichinella nativa]